MPTSPAISAREGVLKSKAALLVAEEKALLDRLEEVRRLLAGCGDEQRRIEAAKEAENRTGGVAGVAVTAMRAASELGTFTGSELTAELGCSYGTASRHLKAMQTADPPLVVSAGRAMGKPLYEWVGPGAEPLPDVAPPPLPRAEPESPPPLRAVPDPGPVDIGTEAPERGAPIAGTGRDLASQIQDKDVRKAAREAISHGWELRPNGKNTYLLVKGARRVPVHGHPRNPGGAVNNIKRGTRERAAS